MGEEMNLVGKRIKILKGGEYSSPGYCVGDVVVVLSQGYKGDVMARSVENADFPDGLFFKGGHFTVTDDLPPGVQRVVDRANETVGELQERVDHFQKENDELRGKLDAAEKANIELGERLNLMKCVGPAEDRRTHSIVNDETRKLNSPEYLLGRADAFMEACRMLTQPEHETIRHEVRL